MDPLGLVRLTAGTLLLLGLPGLLWSLWWFPPAGARPRSLREAFAGLAHEGPLGWIQRAVVTLLLSTGLVTVTLYLGSRAGLLDVDLAGGLLAVALLSGIPVALIERRHRAPPARVEPPPREAPPGRLELLLLAVILVFAGVKAWIPHRGFPYPLHVDEFNHMAFTQALLKAGSVVYPSPFWHPGSVTDQEVGFHLLAALAHLFAGVSVLSFTVYAGVALSVLLSFLAYAAFRRHDWGLEAALFAAFVPTHVRFLGPAFAVPVALGLVLVLFTCYVLDHLHGRRGYGLLALLFLLVALVHPPTLLPVGVLIAAYGLPQIGANPRRTFLLLLLVAAGGFVVLRLLAWLSPFIASFLSPPARFLPWVPITDFVPWWALGLVAVAVLFTVFEKEPIKWALAIATLLVLGTLVAYRNFGLGHPVLYDRGLLYAFLLLNLLAAYGLAKLRRVAQVAAEESRRASTSRLHALQTTRLASFVVPTVALLVAAGAAGAAYADHASLSYYRMVDEETARDLLDLRGHVPEDARGITVPWASKAFVALTGLRCYTELTQVPSPEADARNARGLAFLLAGARDSAFLNETGVTVVLSPFPVANPALRQVEGTLIYLYDPAGSGPASEGSES